MCGVVQPVGSLAPFRQRVVALQLTLAGWAVLELGLRVRERLQGRGGTARDRATRALIAVSSGSPSRSPW